jgi:uncharacterized protein YprB with RNaseH-like and TPR domain
MGTRLTPVALDIETTGFGITQAVTVLGYSMPLGCRVFLYTGGRGVGEENLEASLTETFGTTIKLTSHSTKTELLEAHATFVDESIRPQDYMLVAYNGERYRGGFDLPFLRTRYARSGIDWPFDGVPYADMMPIFQNRFNTTTEGEEVADLEGVYEALIGGELTDQDPFEESNIAVTAFENARFEELLAHNIADILRTDALATLAQQYCSKGEFNLKSLTPTIRDPALESGNTR